MPLGMRQRLSLAVAIVHKPELLILDEPTSGVDPIARDEFWRVLIELSRHEGVTIFVSTHFMNEAARCDRIALMHAVRVLVTGSPQSLVTSGKGATLEEVFVAYLEEAEAAEQQTRTIDARMVAPAIGADVRRASGRKPSAWFSLRRLFTYAIRETLELMRDPIRLGFALFGTLFLMAVFGAGISMDVDNLSFAVLDRDGSPDSRAYLSQLQGSPYFLEKAPIGDAAELERRLQSGDVQAAIEIPPGFGRDLNKGVPTEIGAGSTARCRSGPRRSEAICRAFTRSFLPSTPCKLARRAGLRRPISRPVSATTRTSTAFMRWCRGLSRCCLP
jgi:ribosome-dependent ATPase